MDNRSMVIDVHCHVWTPRAAEEARTAHPERLEPVHRFGGKSAEHNQRLFADIEGQLTHPAVRLEDMNRMGIDVQAISVSPMQYYYSVQPEAAARLCRLENDRLAEIVAGHPGRFVGLGTVPLQDTDRALKELDHVVGELGFRGLEICTSVNGEDLDGARFDPFWEAVADLGLLVVLHPSGFTEGTRLSDYYLINVIGHPLDSTIAVSRLIFGGVLERHDLNICIVHGGGYLPFYAARMDHAYEVRPECREYISAPPSDYLRRLYFDTLVFTPDDVARLVTRFGADHVLLGTDYPYDMGEPDPRGLLSRVPDLTEQDREQILGRNAARLLRLDG